MRLTRWGGHAAALVFATCALVVVPALPVGSPPPASAAALPAISTAQLADPVFMEAFYRQHLMAAIPPLGFTGDVATCTLGEISVAAIESELTRLNAYRAIAGVPSAVVDDPAHHADAQAGAVAIIAQPDSLMPAAGDPCASSTALDAIGHSALAGLVGGRPPVASEAAVDQAIDVAVSSPGLLDRDALLQPTLTSLAVGGATYAGVDSSAVLFHRAAAPASWSAVRDPDGLVAWPPCGGAVPYPLAHGMWSVARPGLATDTATLSVTRNGAAVGAEWHMHRTPGSVEESSGYLVEGAFAGLLQPAPGTIDDYVVTIDGARQDGNPVSVDCEFKVIDVNVDPIDLVLDDNGVAPGKPAGTAVGSLTPHDLLGIWFNGLGSDYSFELVSGEGDDDNAQFAIADGQLVTSAPFVHVEGTRTVRVRATENRPPGNPIERSFTIVVAREPEPIPPVAPAELTVAENLPAGTLVATWPATDANGFPLTYTMDPEPVRSTDLVAIVGNEVRTTRTLDFERDRRQQFYVTTSNGTFTATTVISLQVLDAPEEPSRPAASTAPPARPGEVIVIWTAPERGAPVEQYTVAWPGGTVVLDGGARSYRIVGLPEGVDSIVTITATNRFGNAADTLTVRPASAARWPTAYTPVQPARLLDTRPGSAIGYAGDKPGPGSVVEVQITGRDGIPAEVAAVALNVTITDATDAGYVTAYPGGGAPPNVSNLNVGAGATVANSVIVKVGAGGRVALHTERGGHLIADIAGYWTRVPGGSGHVAAGRVLTVAPRRVLDTRGGLGAVGPLLAGSSIRIPVTGVGDVPASGVAAITMNLTATEPAAPGYFTVWPGGTARPNSSNLNIATAGQTLANQVIVPIGSDGTIEIYSERGSHLIADITGYVTDATAAASAAGLFVPLDPFRRIDTRAQTHPVPGGDRVSLFENVDYINGKWRGEMLGFALNITATGTSAAGFVSVYPCSQTGTETSTLNMNGPGETVPNAAIASGGSSASVCVTPSVTTDLIADVFGYFLRF